LLFTDAARRVAAPSKNHFAACLQDHVPHQPAPRQSFPTICRYHEHLDPPLRPHFTRGHTARDIVMDSSRRAGIPH
jgi:hypothetical protein